MKVLVMVYIFGVIYLATAHAKMFQSNSRWPKKYFHLFWASIRLAGAALVALTLATNIITYFTSLGAVWMIAYVLFDYYVNELRGVDPTRWSGSDALTDRILSIFFPNKNGPYLIAIFLIFILTFLTLQYAHN